MTDKPYDEPTPQESLDPEDWDEFRAQAHRMLESALDRMQSSRQGRVWTELPADIKDALKSPLPRQGLGTDDVISRMETLLPYGAGNTNPRFFGWVHGSGTPSNILAEMAASSMNANVGGRDHGAIYVEKQVISWCRELFEFPETASGIVVSGTSMATIIAIKVARDARLDFASRKDGVCGHGLVGYTSTETHSCVARAFDMVGLGTDALRRIPANDRFEIDMDALRTAITKDRAAGLTPFVVIGTAGTVNVGAIDPLEELADLAKAENLWFHIDGAFGALGVLSERARDRLTGIKRADSLAFDFHKWLHVNYDAGFALVRDETLHRATFTDRPDYLKAKERGLAGGNPWPVEYGPELSRGFRALKVWAQLAEFGTDRLGRMITRNCYQASYLGEQVAMTPGLELLAPVALNICCFRHVVDGLPDAVLNAMNDEIVIQLQEQGIAAPSTTQLHGRTAIRVNITNHRTARKDLDILLSEIVRIAASPEVAAVRKAAEGAPPS
ncbi:MAG: cytochrome D ubiquinol oxidase subunit I [Hyphomonas sp. BRH_c22]|uniref:pyridoxal phosphate-dependent decarboxylase family protein n=1 Tax=Hyphomonas sp. BRH_c22 TaxID=1629710 RepID=UPI0005F221B8|nr:pyridoxal-dependent decarboxylase [Hyphomonas sp. BRH_c22]KJS35509.1 MAG: cytochrome D ubiquinol oxidase subunit I [Hyphomonas sp. BRH_c22]